MPLSICPAAVVAAPVETVWALLADPARYDSWWDARVVRVDPPGPAAPGQVVYAQTAQHGRKWDVTLKILSVNPAKHQIQFDITLPLGITNHQTTTCTALDGASSAGAESCRVQFG